MRASSSNCTDSPISGNWSCYSRAVPILVFIGILIAAVVLLVQHWDTIKPAVMNTVNLFRKGGVFSGAMDVVIFQLKQAVRLIDKMVDGLKFLFRTAKSVGAGLGEAEAGIVQALGGGAKSSQQLFRENELRRAAPFKNLSGINAASIGAGAIAGGGLLGTIEVNFRDRNNDIQSVRTRSIGAKLDTGRNQPSI